MRQSITTKYIGPSNTQGGRIKAVARKRQPLSGWPEQSLTEPYRYEGTEREHCRAAKLLAARLGWSGLWIGGGNVDENGYVYVCLEGSFSRAWVDKYICDTEDADWFYLPPDA